MRQPKYHLGKY